MSGEMGSLLSPLMLKCPLLDPASCLTLIFLFLLAMFPIAVSAETSQPTAPPASTPVEKISQRGSPGKRNLPAGILGQKFSIPGHFQKSAKISFALYPGEKKLIPVKIFRYASPVKF